MDLSPDEGVDVLMAEIGGWDAGRSARDTQSAHVSRKLDAQAAHVSRVLDALEQADGGAESVHYSEYSHGVSLLTAVGLCALALIFRLQPS